MKFGIFTAAALLAKVSLAARQLTKKTKKTLAPTQPPSMSLTYQRPDREIILAADLWSPFPKILSGEPGFQGIVGISAQNQGVVEATGGAWNSNLNVCPLSGLNAPAKVRTASIPAQFIANMYDCTCKANLFDGLPLCFSWPIVPSSIKRDFIQYTRSDGAVFSPRCISGRPNFEYNERHCIVMFDNFMTRAVPGEPGRLYMKKIEVIGDLMLVGPNGTRVSAKGMSNEPSSDKTSYQSGPFIMASRLDRLNNIGETSAILPSATSAANSGLDLYGDQCDSEYDYKYRLRIFFSGGMTPDGVTNLKPTQFADYFTIKLKTGFKVEDTSPNMVTYNEITALMSVLGLADLGSKQDQYDDCYEEDKDNYIDFIICVSGPETEAEANLFIQVVDGVIAFEKQKYLFTPGGPGQTPTLGTRYTAPSGPNQYVATNVDVEGHFKTTYCKHQDGTISTSEETCSQWLDSGEIAEAPNGTPVEYLQSLQTCPTI